MLICLYANLYVNLYANLETDLRANLISKIYTSSISNSCADSMLYHVTWRPSVTWRTLGLLEQDQLAPRLGDMHTSQFTPTLHAHHGSIVPILASSKNSRWDIQYLLSPTKSSRIEGLARQRRRPCPQSSPDRPKQQQQQQNDTNQKDGYMEDNVIDRILRL